MVIFGGVGAGKVEELRAMEERGKVEGGEGTARG